MTQFLIAAAGLAVFAAILLVLPLLRGAGRAENRDEADARIFRDQLEEVERDLARGVISSGEAEGARAEISRRLLRAAQNAERRGQGRAAPGVATGLVAGLALIATPLIGGAVYLATGTPGLPDLPLAQRQGAAVDIRMSQAEAEALAAEAPRPAPRGLPADYVALVERLEKIVAERTDDPEGARLLANAYMQLERYADAWPLYERVIGLAGDAATGDLFASQAEAMVLAVGGYVSPEAEQVISDALRRDGSQPVARYYAGLAVAQRGRIDEALGIWRALLADAPPDAPWAGFVRETIAEVTGAPLPPPTDPAPAPADQTEAGAGAIPAEDRMAMIEGMVERLQARLSEDGGEPEEFVRLINAYRVLGRTEDARRALELSQQKLEGSAASFVREQALLMGVEPE